MKQWLRQRSEYRTLIPIQVVHRGLGAAGEVQQNEVNRPHWFIFTSCPMGGGASYTALSLGLSSEFSLFLSGETVSNSSEPFSAFDSTLN